MVTNIIIELVGMLGREYWNQITSWREVFREGKVSSR